MPSISMTITGTGINYQQSATVSAGSVSVNQTGSTTTILPSGKLGSSGGGCGQGGGGQGGWGQGDPAPGRSGQGSGGQGGGSGGSGSGGSGSGGSGSGGSGSGGSGSGGSGSTGSGAGSSETSSNWSGYAAATSLTNPKADSVTAVSGTWTQPTATASGNTTAYCSVWVGIDGYSSNSVEQIGTDSDIVNGKATYYAWYEMYPADAVNITSMTISAGNSITASVQYLTSGAHSGQFELTITDTSRTGDSFTIYETDAQAQRSSAEWVVEAPSSGYGVLPLANFGSVTITNASATINGKTGAIDSSNWQETAITMAGGSGVEASVSTLTDSGGTSSFTDTYESSGGASRNAVQTSSRSIMLRQSVAALPSGNSSPAACENDLGLRAGTRFLRRLTDSASKWPFVIPGGIVEAAVPLLACKQCWKPGETLFASRAPTEGWSWHTGRHLLELRKPILPCQRPTGPASAAREPPRAAARRRRSGPRTAPSPSAAKGREPSACRGRPAPSNRRRRSPPRPRG